MCRLHKHFFSEGKRSMKVTLFFFKTKSECLISMRSEPICLRAVFFLQFYEQIHINMTCFRGRTSDASLTLSIILFVLNRHFISLKHYRSCTTFDKWAIVTWMLFCFLSHVNSRGPSVYTVLYSVYKPIVLPDRFNVVRYGPLHSFYYKYNYLASEAIQNK